MMRPGKKLEPSAVQGAAAELVRLAKEKGLWLTGPGGLHSTGRRVDELLSTIEGIDPPPV